MTQNYTIYAQSKTNNVYVQGKTFICVAQKSRQTLVAAAVQGPPGSSTGGSATDRSVIKIIASETLGSNRAVAMNGAYPIAAPAIGLTKMAVTIGMETEIVLSGELNGFTNLISDKEIFLALNGLITQTPPTAGILQKLGFAKSPDVMVVQIFQSIMLGE